MADKKKLLNRFTGSGEKGDDTVAEGADNINPFSGDGFLSFGAGDRGRAAKAAKMARTDWDRLDRQYNDTPAYGTVDPESDIRVYGSPWEAEWAGMQDSRHGGASRNLTEYQKGPEVAGVDEQFLDYTGAQQAGLQPSSAATDEWGNPIGSEWEGKTSAYGDMGPSAYDGYESAYGNMDPSAYGDLAYNADALSRQQQGGDYFANLSSGGPDAAAEADYQRRAAMAESSRRANTDAAMSQLEQRGQGNANAGLLADLSNQQASVSDQYLAGLDAAGQTQMRRDNAARQGADIGNQIGAGMLEADRARAGGLDTYSANKAAGLDSAEQARRSGLDLYGVNQAAGQDAFSANQYGGMDANRWEGARAQDDFANNRYDEYYGVSERNADRDQGAANANAARAWQTGDANTDMRNNAAWQNRITNPQQQFENKYRITSGQAGAAGGVASTYGGNAQQAAQNNQFLFKQGQKGVEAILGGGG